MVTGEVSSHVGQGIGARDNRILLRENGALRQQVKELKAYIRGMQAGLRRKRQEEVK